MEKPLVLILTPTPGEYAGVANRLAGKERARFRHWIIESGPGKINAAAALAAALAPLKRDKRPPALILGVGTAGSLSHALKAGEVVVADEAIVGDWRHDDGDEIHVGPYAVFAYGPPDPARVEAMAIKSRSPLASGLKALLEREGFTPGRVLTTDSFVAGRENKLRLGELYKAAVCDMESGAFAWTAEKIFGVPWLCLRIVADSLDETLNDYFLKERDVTEVLGEKTALALDLADQLLA
ncbi:MAG: hypothetical protein LBO66_10760 [Deltaproteobacteria bacterium]|jgi:nucleoside phosphorylase|nr:hypothetical protein [Deltaproteobacteria bacterium]